MHAKLHRSSRRHYDSQWVLIDTKKKMLQNNDDDNNSKTKKSNYWFGTINYCKMMFDVILACYFLQKKTMVFT